MRCATTSLSTRISIVECPNRVGTNILKGVGAEVAKRISLRTDVYASSSELAPVRPLLLVYGEDRSVEELRSKFNLKQDDVFIFGNTKNGAGDEACGWFPFLTHFFFGGSALYVPAHLVQRPPSLAWDSRPCLVGFLSMRASGRQRCFRTAVMSEITKCAGKSANQ